MVRSSRPTPSVGGYAGNLWPARPPGPIIAVGRSSSTRGDDRRCQLRGRSATFRYLGSRPCPRLPAAPSVLPVVHNVARRRREYQGAEVHSCRPLSLQSPARRLPVAYCVPHSLSALHFPPVAFACPPCSSPPPHLPKKDFLVAPPPRPPPPPPALPHSSREPAPASPAPGWTACFAGCKADNKARQEMHSFAGGPSSIFVCHECLATQSFKNAPEALLYSDVGENAPY